MSENHWIEQYCLKTAENFDALQKEAAHISSAVRLITTAMQNGNKLMICGNGGSAADAQHIAAEFIGHFLKDRQALPALALTTDSSTLTSVSNDLGFDNVFARQVHGLGKTGDVLLAISTSGNSVNILRAVEAAKSLEMSTVSLTGASGGDLAPLSDVTVKVPSSETSHIQEMHIAVGHMLCALVEKAIL